MRLLVVSSAPLIPTSEGWEAYSPYVKEMQFWAKYADEVQFCCPVWKTDRNLLVSSISFPMEPPIELDEFDIKSLKNVIKSIWAVMTNFVTICKAMHKADHIHLRCPGNIGLLGCIAQIFFPKKVKTAKYAGNWDPKSKQPFSYKLQRWILSNTFLTHNMQVLVYGEWENSTKNIKPFFTATYHEKDKREVLVRNFSGEIRFLFVGTLSKGKQPLYAIQLVEKLYRLGYNVSLKMYGEGTERALLESYITDKKLDKFIALLGNQNTFVVQESYQNSHFSILPSQSEGWPKVLAEAMFWGCVPIASPVSCVSNMLDYGNRGLILTMDLNHDTEQINHLIKDTVAYQMKAKKGVEWARYFTLDYFEEEIRKLINK